MLIDQDETPLFLGAIHRLFHGTRLDQLDGRRRAPPEPTSRTSSEAEASTALAPRHLVLTDGDLWATVRIDVPAGHAVVQLVDEVLLPGCPGARHGSATPTRVAAALEQVRRAGSPRPCCPAVDLDVVVRRRAAGRPAAREGDVVPAEAEPRVVHPSLLDE